MSDENERATPMQNRFIQIMTQKADEAEAAGEDVSSLRDLIARMARAFGVSTPLAPPARSWPPRPIRPTKADFDPNANRGRA